jgi:hypothetical protein
VSEAIYGDPLALSQAINDRLRALVRERHGSQLADLRRQFAYDRLLSRVFQGERDQWVLKGATAMLARLAGVARHTLDIDLYWSKGHLAEAEVALRAAAAVDLGDYFRFTLSPGRRIAQGLGAIRVPLAAYLGATVFANFHVDLVANLTMTGTPDEVPPLVPLNLPGIVSSTYRAYPVADHVADKVCALLELHPRQDDQPAPSTRYRDLADLAIFSHTARVDARALAIALSSEAMRRALTLPDRLVAPQAPGWRAGYSRIARDTPGLVERDVSAAIETVGRFIDPVLGHAAAGRWNPKSLTWDRA